MIFVFSGLPAHHLAIKRKRLKHNVEPLAIMRENEPEIEPEIIALEEFDMADKDQAQPLVSTVNRSIWISCPSAILPSKRLPRQATAAFFQPHRCSSRP